MPYPIAAVRGNKTVWRSAVKNGLLNSLVAYWPGNVYEPVFREEDRLKDVHSGLNLTKSGTVGEDVGLVYSVAQEYGSGVHYLNDNPAIDTGSNSFTIAAWVKFGLLSFYETDIIAKTSASLGDREFILYSPSFASLRFGVSVDGNSYTTVSIPAVSGGGWHLLIAWHDAAEHKFGLQLDTDAPVTGSVELCRNGSAPLVIGGASGSMGFTGFFDGCIGPVAFWKSEAGGSGMLTEYQRKALYNGGRGLRYNNFVA